jgi:hypothetical protein
MITWASTPSIVRRHLTGVREKISSIETDLPMGAGAAGEADPESTSGAKSAGGAPGAISASSMRSNTTSSAEIEVRPKKDWSQRRKTPMPPF